MVEIIKQDLINKLSKDRYEHTLRVVDMCVRLAEKYGADLEKTKMAALLHDSAKLSSNEEQVKMADSLNLLSEDIYYYNKEIVHPILGAKLAEDKYAIDDEDILNAIKYHTTGRENMSLLEKIIFIGDYIEPERKFDGIEEIRELAFKDLDASILLALNTSLKFLLENDRLISPNTLKSRNYLMIEKIKKKEATIC